MMNQEHWKKLEHMYLSANINAQIFDTTTIHITNGSAEIGLSIVPKYYHALGAMHGSVYFKLLDDAAFFAVNSVVEDVFVLTKSFDIHFRRPVSSGIIAARGSLLTSDESIYVAKSELYTDTGKLAGWGQGAFVKSKVGLSKEIGYV